MSVVENVLNQVSPEQVYHYTSIAGLLGIARSKTLWASNIHHLNDEQEFAHGLEIVRAQLRDRRAKSSLNNRERLFVDKLETRLGAISGVNILVASFSEVSDLLSQWRGYCPAGKGVSVGFYSADLGYAGARQGFRLARAVYDLETQRAIANELVEEALHRQRSNTLDEDDVIRSFVNTAGGLLPLLKHETFSEEKEWRLVSQFTSIKHPQMRVREGVARLVPYFEFDFAGRDRPARVGKITIGPTPHAKLAAQGIYDALEIHQLNYEEFRRSRIPYRQW